MDFLNTFTISGHPGFYCKFIVNNSKVYGKRKTLCDIICTLKTVPHWTGLDWTALDWTALD